MFKLNYLLLLLIPFIVSCSGVSGYYSKLETFMTNQNYQSAQNLTKSSKEIYGNKNEFLYYLDLGLLEHISKNYQQSNEAFEQAKQIYSKNYTESISAGVVSLFTNDNVITYYGYPYEIVYVNVFCALNYILLGQNNEAAVEARQADNVFKKIKIDSQNKAFYKDDAFVRYFMGLIYENAGYYNDALVSYKLAVKDYNKISQNIPQDVIDSLYTMYCNLSMFDEAEKLEKIYPTVKCLKYENSGELIIVNYNGLSPKKVDNIIELSFYRAWPYFVSNASSSYEQEKVEEVKSIVRAGIADDFIKVAFPKYVRFKNAITSFSVEEIKDNSLNEISKSYLASDVATLMEQVLKSNNATIYGKTIARAVARYVLTKVAVDQVRQQERRENRDNTLSLLTNSVLNITSSLLEKADKRSWRTLPANINMARIMLPVGVHNLKINYLDSKGAVVTTENITAEIELNKKKFIVVNSYKNV